MRVLAGGEWRDGVLDYARGADEYRIAVRAMYSVAPVPEMYFVRAASGRMLLNYVREVGIRGVLRRVRSRRSERLRNEKWIGCGVGEVVDAPAGSAIPVGSVVTFLAPAHPRCLERLCLPEDMLRARSDSAGSAVRDEAHTLLHATSTTPILPDSWHALAGWSPFAGVSLDPATTARALDDAERLLRGVDWRAAKRLSPTGTPLSTVRAAARAPESEARLRGTLLGYGNYAKIAILPNVRDHVAITRIHEIDPLQIPLEDHSVIWDTAPTLAASDSPQVVFIAGYHHTHAPIAVEALGRGAYAVAEKPVATDRGQVDALTQAIRRSPRFFACFHKRYSLFNDWARQDLAVSNGAAISYHCVVYEVPLPSRHWYRWPASRSRLVSNGCHWLDHFLFLNDWSPVRRSGLDVARDGTLSVWAELANDAYFTMTLTDRGSERIGVQEYIELRANRRTIRVTNGSRYESEDGARVIRTARRNKMDSYSRMYRSIAAAVARGEAGDSIESVERSSALVLDLEAQLFSQSARQDR